MISSATGSASQPFALEANETAMIFCPGYASDLGDYHPWPEAESSNVCDQHRPASRERETEMATRTLVQADVSKAVLVIEKWSELPPDAGEETWTE